jgi:hypothetical protein
MKLIDQAPKDGRWIIGYKEEHKYPILIRWSRYSDGEMDFDTWEDIDQNEYYDDDFTHYIDIPQSIEQGLKND